MSLPDLPPAPRGDWPSWGNRLVQWLIRTKDKLTFITSGYSAHDNGLLLWDEVSKSVVVSIDGDFVNVVSAAHSTGLVTTDQTALAANTAYAISIDSLIDSYGVSLGSPVSRMVVDRAGTYSAEFTVSVLANAGNGSAWAWLRVNGTDVANSAVQCTVTSGAGHKVAALARTLTLSVGDYVELCYAVSDTNITLDYVAASGFAPAVPAATLKIARIG